MVVYLSGSMIGLPVIKAGSWRREAELFLTSSFVKVYNPMRHVPLITSDAIASPYGVGLGLACTYNLKMSDVVLCRLNTLSPGTVFELGMAHAWGKPIVAFDVCQEAVEHPLLALGWDVSFNQLKDALNYIRKLGVK